MTPGRLVEIRSPAGWVVLVMSLLCRIRRQSSARDFGVNESSASLHFRAVWASQSPARVYESHGGVRADRRGPRRTTADSMTALSRSPTNPPATRQLRCSTPARSMRWLRRQSGEERVYRSEPDGGDVLVPALYRVLVVGAE